MQDITFTPFNLNSLLKNNIDVHVEAVQAISLKASKEFSLEQSLEKMKNDWQGIAFHVMPYKDTGTYIVGGVDDIQVPPSPSPLFTCSGRPCCMSSFCPRFS